MPDVLSLNRIGASEFIVPYCKFLKSLNYPFSVGTRFKVGCENEDANERSTFFKIWKSFFHLRQYLELPYMFVGPLD